MAIKVGGTTVIDDSRNVANLGGFKTVGGNSILGTGDIAVVSGVTATAPVASSGGTAPVISMSAASSAVNGYMTGAYATKLDGIAASATNVTNTNQLTNGAGYTTNTGTVTSVSGTGTVSGLTLSGTVTSSGNLTLSGSISFPVTSVNGQTGAVTISTGGGGTAFGKSLVFAR